jgi:hypothetical protein
LRLTDNSALPSRLERVFKCDRQFTLRGCMTLGTRWDCKDQLQRLYEGPRRDPQRGSVPGHPWPFLKQFEQRPRDFTGVPNILAQVIPAADETSWLAP